MAQLSIYIDDKTLRKVERAARSDKKSISRWVSDKLSNSIPFQAPLENSIDVDSLNINQL